VARPLRIECEGGCYHVMNRGNRGQDIFATEEDYGFFVDRLVHFGGTFRVGIRSYCLMPNHFHIHLRTEEANLSRFMQSLLTSYAVVFNRRHELSGHLFQRRFKAVLVEDEVYGAELSRYIHLNPVRGVAQDNAGIKARRTRLRAFRWSSYASLIGLRACPSWLDRDSVLGGWGKTLSGQRRAYAEYVEQGLVRDIPNPLDAAVAQAVLGSEAFVDRVRRALTDLSERPRLRRELPQAAALHAAVPLEELVDHVSKAYATDPQSLLRRHSRGNEARQVLLYLACMHCRGRHSLTELAERLGPITVGGLTHARYVAQARMRREASMGRRIAHIEQQLQAADKYKQ
jgi:putative transposase